MTLHPPTALTQAIADSWPDSIDDSAARAEWDWAPTFDLTSMATDMIEKLTSKLAEND